MSEVFLSRQNRILSLIQESQLSGIVLNPGPTLTYLTGLSFHLFERPIVLVLIPGYPPAVILPELELLKISNLSYEITPFPYGEDPNTWDEVFKKAAKSIGLTIGKIGVEPTRLRFLELHLLENAFEGVSFVSAESIVAEIRMRKGEDEILYMRKAVEIAQKALQNCLPLIRLGMSELDLAAEFTLQLFRLGSESEVLAYPIVQFGANTANPHGGPTHSTLQQGDLVLFDFGAGYRNYYSDITRTFIAGEPTPKIGRIAQVVKDANEAARAILRPGIQAGQVDQAARQVIDASGYAKFFTHRTGHGLGMEGHEEPYIRAGNPLILEPGMTFTIEPGIYLPGIGGVRIEDDVVITKDGGESLSNLPRELLPVT